jgi:hypothetical protein
VGRNRFHNGLFRVAQRGAGAFTSSGYTADRWRVDVAGGDAFSASVVSLSDADRTAIGDDDATNAIQIVTTATNTSSSQTVSKQRIEGVRTLAGKQVTVSFYGKLASGSATIGMSYRQSFGTGGSPSGDVTGAINTASVGVGSLTRFTATFTLPSTSGKTLGSNGDDFLELNFWLSCAPGNANVSLAVQSSSGSVLSLRISSTGTGTGSCLSDVLASADL